MDESQSSPQENPPITETQSSPEEKPAIAESQAPPRENPPITETQSSPEEKPAVAESQTPAQENPPITESQSSPEEKPAVAESQASPQENPPMGDSKPSAPESRASSDPFAWLDKCISAEAFGKAVDSARENLYRLSPLIYTVTKRPGLEVKWKKERCWWTALPPEKPGLSYLCAAASLLNHTRKPFRLHDLRLISSSTGSALCYHSILSSQGPANREIEVLPQEAVDLSLEIGIRARPPAAIDFWMACTLQGEDKDSLPIHLVLRPLATILGEIAPPHEPGFQISDPMEKQIVSVLHSEFAELRSRGPEHLGSVAAPSENEREPGSEQPQLRANSGRQVVSPNGESLLRLYSSLTTAEERPRFRAALCQRLRAESGYGPVAYLILWVLFGMGSLSEGLAAAEANLSGDSLALFGIRRLMVLLLQWEWRSFSDSLLDDVERFVCQLGDPFRSAERIAAIRTLRLSTPG
ncbi:hypothetical protein [Verrucomicrobium sp. 3C]|uniref:hypothetical protein n=1 Tax=Verrucomicrobium sp. 3C TaxID=1134055 RepID=UPI00037D28B3|nr:hypothetical protein [Verrucomicrobium sp. 3C]